MDAMLMGGIVPNAITNVEVDKYLATNTRRKKKVQYGGHKFSANNWKAVLLGILSPGEYQQLVDLLTHYLRTAANYSIAGGPRAVEAMGIVRGMIGNATQPIPQLIVRVIRDMRTLRPSIKKVRRQMFIDERNPVKALGYMQFIPGVGIYRDTIQSMPSSYSKKILKYMTDPALRSRAAARALIKARNLTDDPNYVPELMGAYPLTEQQYLATYRLSPAIRQSMRWTPGPNPNSRVKPATLARLARGRQIAQDNLTRVMAQIGNMPNVNGAFTQMTEAQAARAARTRALRAVQAARAAAREAENAAAAAAEAAAAEAAAPAAAAAAAADVIPPSPPYVPSSPPQRPLPPTPPRRTQRSLPPVPIPPGNPPGYDPIDGEY